MVYGDTEYSMSIAIVPKEHIQKVLIIGSIGIGNLILFSPALRRLRELLPHCHITLLVLKESFRDLYTADLNVNELIALTDDHYKYLLKKLQLIRDLRKQRYDLTIVTFPANRIEYNLLAYCTGAKYRIAHAYPFKGFRTMSFLQNARIPMEKTLHDVEQNLNLIRPLDNEYIQNRNIYMAVPEAAVEKADSFIQHLAIPSHDVVIGIHPGSSEERGMQWKRWYPERFAQLIHRLRKQVQVHTFLFGGERESQLKAQIAEEIGANVQNIQTDSITEAAAFIRHCTLFISNDSGLMHVAVAMQVPVIALFGPSDVHRTAPYSPNAEVIRADLSCSPCWSIENVGVGHVPCLYDSNICMQAITVDEVYEKTLKLLHTLGYAHVHHSESS